jgi:tRNA dimethylallyltransferase
MTPRHKPLLIVVTGPTASGKSALAVDLALTLGCDIISADSRQIYRGIPIATAAPTREQLSAVRHHLVGTLPLDAYYSASLFADQASALLPRLFASGGNRAIVCGGSMMYIDALTEGLDDLPTVSDEVRSSVLRLYNAGGLEAIRSELATLDPAYMERVDLSNPRRIIHAIEISLMAGRPYSELIGRKAAVERPYDIVRMAIGWPREQLFGRIAARTSAMMAEGLLDEARSVMHLRHLNALNTVGIKEALACLDGLMSPSEAEAKLARNTRVYAKKQLTWMRRYPDLYLLDPAAPLLPQALPLTL